VVTGVPPHIKELVDLEALRKEHSELTNKVYQKVMNGLWQYFEVRQIGGRQLTEARIREMITEGCRQTAEDLANQIEVKLDLLASSFEESTGSGGRVALQRNETLQQRETYCIRTNTLGQLTRLPDDFQLPKGNAFDCWNQC
jgi:alanyl-tRNA synthetase